MPTIKTSIVFSLTDIQLPETESRRLTIYDLEPGDRFSHGSVRYVLLRKVRRGAYDPSAIWNLTAGHPTVNREHEWDYNPIVCPDRQPEQPEPAPKVPLSSIRRFQPFLYEGALYAWVSGQSYRERFSCVALNDDGTFGYTIHFTDPGRSLPVTPVKATLNIETRSN